MKSRPRFRRPHLPGPFPGLLPHHEMPLFPPPPLFSVPPFLGARPPPFPLGPPVPFFPPRPPMNFPPGLGNPMHLPLHPGCPLPMPAEMWYAGAHGPIHEERLNAIQSESQDVSSRESENIGNEHNDTSQELVETLSSSTHASGRSDRKTGQRRRDEESTRRRSRSRSRDSHGQTQRGSRRRDYSPQRPRSSRRSPASRWERSPDRKRRRQHERGSPESRRLSRDSSSRGRGRSRDHSTSERRGSWERSARDRSQKTSHSSCAGKEPQRSTRPSQNSRARERGTEEHGRYMNSNQSRKRETPFDRPKDGGMESSPEGSDGERKHMEKISAEEMLQEEQVLFIRCSPAELFYERDEQNPRLMKGTTQLKKLCEQFKVQLGTRVERITGQQSSENSDVSCSLHVERCSHDDGESGHSESESSEEEGELKNDTQASAILELERKQQHPERLHSELWHNEPGEMNDMPVCRCSLKARKTGIRHGFYEGETHVPPCEPFSNNVSRLHHYRITVSPPTNFLVKTPTVINHDGHEFIFEGFSMLSHFPLEKFPVCGIIRFNIRYAIHYVEEKFPENFCAEELNLFSKILFRDILELYDLDLKAAGDEHGCSQFHFLPRFVRELPDHGKEILSMCYVMRYLLEADQDLIPPEEIKNLVDLPDSEWQNFADKVKGMIVTYPGKKPSSVRVDQLDREQENPDALQYPQLIHFGMRPLQLSYAGNPDYQRAWKEYLKFRYLLANRPKPSETDKHKLHDLEMKAQKLRSHSKLKREVTIALSAEGFRRTGIFCDVIQHAMLLPILICHLRFHRSLDSLEQLVSYHFKNRYLLQLALTHPSYKGNYGTNRDHARNSLTNCGIRQLAYGDRMIHFRRKRGINTLIHIMSLFGQDRETDSNVTHYERLEFLGDAVVEFLSTIHLFFMFPGLEEGGLATYRSALVQNKHLAVLAKKLNLEKYLLYGHGSELCHDSELRHALANSYEAVMAALFLDGGLQVADRIFSETLFQGEMDLLEVWNNLPLHPLQEQEPSGDRHWIESIPFLKELLKFEEYTGLEFKHIRLLARAFTDHSIGFNNLTIGSNERLEFLGDTVLQLIVSDFLYKHFPDHHEGHLSLLRSSLVNNKTQAVVCDDIGLTRFARAKLSLNNWKTKSKADLLEALLGAIFVDRGMTHCYTFCKVCFFPRLQEFIVNQDWIDPKSKLQQCCLTLRGLNCEEPDMPLYKVIESKGPTNRRTYRVAVYFRGKRMAEAVNNSIQQAEMDAAKLALKKWRDLFPQLEHQERVLRKLKQKKGK